MDRNWNLEVLYSSFADPKFSADFDALKAAIAEFNAWATAELTDDTNPVAKMEHYVTFTNEMVRFTSLDSYARLTVTTDAKNGEAMKALDKISNIRAEAVPAHTLFKAFVGRIADIDAVIAQSEILKAHAFVLKEIAQGAKYSLPAREEALIAKMRTTGSDAFGNLAEGLAATLMIDVTIDGVTKKYPLAAVRNMGYSASAEVRKIAYEAEIAAYPRIEQSVAVALNAIKGDAILNATMRGYDDVLDMTLQAHRLDRPVLMAMLEAMRESFPMFRRFYLKKAELLGYSGGLPWYDLNAPVGSVDISFTYEEAADFVVKNYSDFSEEMGAFARHAFDNRWIDVDPKEGKRGGAFCAGVPTLKESRILTNFLGSFSDMGTLAHELGHAYHGYCLNNETPMNKSYSSPIAETASIFAETIVENAALKGASRDEKLVILENSIAGLAQVVVDIYSRYLFEDEVIRRRADGPLSVDELKDIMLRAQKATYGEGLDENLMHPYMWACKTHYYSATRNYYNYPYAYGMLFAKGLYALFMEQGADFVPKYNTLLANTGKMTLAQVAASVGIDVTDKSFWKKSLDVIEKAVDEFCAY